MAAGGIKPFVAIYSTFLQRAYDQIMQDMALNNLPILILVYKSGISSADPTHIGLFDTAFGSTIPNLVCMSPNRDDFLPALDYAIEQMNYPMIMRVPFEVSETPLSLDFTKKTFEPFKSQVLKQGEKIAIYAVSKTMPIANKLINAIDSALHINCSLIDAIWTNEIDKDLALNLSKNHSIFISLEDGLLEGGVGEKLSQLLSTSDSKVLCYGAKKEFLNKTPASQLYDYYGLNAEMILEQIKNLL